MLERLASEVDRVFDDFGLGGHWFAPRSGRSWLRSPWRWASPARWDAWAPDIDMFQRDHDLIVRADLPGLNKDDVKVDVTSDAITIHGERHHDQDTEQGGVFRSERSYGYFNRVIPLPEGAMTDQAKAHFRDGVLEITMPAPPEQVTKGRRLEITETPTKK
jgi:HSP20 family protein